MLDPILLRKDLQTVVDRLKTRGVSFDTERFNDLESRRKAVQTETESLQARRNALAKQIGQLKAKGEDASAVMAESQAVPVRLKQLEEELAALQQPLNELLMSVPNLPHASAPLGESADDNVEMRRWLPAAAGPDGNPQPLAFEARDHVAVGEPLGLDFDMAAKLSGARFHARPDRPPAPRAGPVHAGPADRHARLHRVLYALYRQCFDAVWHGPVAQVQGRHVRRVQGRRR